MNKNNTKEMIFCYKMEGCKDCNYFSRRIMTNSNFLTSQTLSYEYFCNITNKVIEFKDAVKIQEFCPIEENWDVEKRECIAFIEKDIVTTQKEFLKTVYKIMKNKKSWFGFTVDEVYKFLENKLSKNNITKRLNRLIKREYIEKFYAGPDKYYTYKMKKNGKSYCTHFLCED